MSTPEADLLRTRLAAFLSFFKSRVVLLGMEAQREQQLRRAVDVRIRQFAVGRSQLTAGDIFGLISDHSSARFDTMAVQQGLLQQAHLAAPLTLGEELGYVVEAALSLQVIGSERMEEFVKAFVEQSGSWTGAGEAEPETSVPVAPSQVAMPEKVAGLLGHIKDLWSIPANTRRIQEMLTVSETPLGEVCAHIEKDPGLSAQCLRVVNSAYYGVVNRVASVRRAVVMLGYQTTRRIVTLSALMTKLNRQRGDVQFDLNAYWGHSLWVAQAASLVAKTTQVGQPDDYFSAGLIHDIGKLVEYQYLPARMKLIMGSVAKGASFPEAELSILGVNHAVLGAVVAEQWGFPLSVVESVRRHLDPLVALEESELPREAIIVAGLCAVSRRSLPPDELKDWSDVFRLSPDHLEAIREEATSLSIGSLRDLFTAP